SDDRDPIVLVVASELFFCACVAFFRFAGDSIELLVYRGTPVAERGFRGGEDSGDIRMCGSGVIGAEFVLEYEYGHAPIAVFLISRWSCMRRIAHIGWHCGNAARIEYNAAVACGADDIDAVGNMFGVLSDAPWRIHDLPPVVESLESGWHRRAEAIRCLACRGERHWMCLLECWAPVRSDRGAAARAVRRPVLRRPVRRRGRSVSGKGRQTTILRGFRDLAGLGCRVPKLAVWRCLFA